MSHDNRVGVGIFRPLHITESSTEAVRKRANAQTALPTVYLPGAIIDSDVAWSLILISDMQRSASSTTSERQETH